MGRKTRLLRLAWDAWRVSAGGPEAIAARRRERLDALLARARTLPLYRHHWAGISPNADLANLLPMDKSTWIEGFDGSIDDPRVCGDALWAHMQDKSRVGSLWLDRYSVCRSSGVMGRKSLFVHDEVDMDVYWTLWVERGWMQWLGPTGVARMAARGARIAYLVATNGHYAAAAIIRRPSPLGRVQDGRTATISILKTPARIARALERWRPAALVGYPTALEQLAQEQESGRLSLDLLLAVSVSEWVDPEARGRIEAAFKCPLRDTYAASECLALAFACPEGWLHVNEDWAVVEPVDEDGRTVPPGETSATTLVTNLANWVQPVVRFDIEDRVTARPDPCPCGSPFSALRVEGRRHDVLKFERSDGSRVSIPPLALVAILSGMSGVDTGSQFVQTAPDELSVRIEFRRDLDSQSIWAEVERRLRHLLRDLGLAHVTIVRSPIPPTRDPRTGKLRKIWSEVGISASR